MSATDDGFSPRIVDRLVDALVIIDERGAIIYANPALGHLLGRAPEGLLGVPFATLLPERTRNADAAEFATWMGSDPPGRSPGPRRIDVLTADGTELPVDVATFLVTPDDGPRLLVAALWDVELRVDFDRFRRVADDLMTFLARASGTPDEVVTELLGIIAAGLDFDVATAWRWDPTRDELVCEYVWSGEGTAGSALESSSLGMTVKPREGLAGLVADTDTPRWFGDLTRAPHLKRHDAIVEDTMQSAFIFPIRTKDHLVGVIELFSRTKAGPDSALFDAVAAIGSRLGEFLERVELEGQRNDLVARLEDAGARQAFLLESSLALAEAGGFEETIRRLSEVAVPALGEICLIDIVAETGTLERLAARHADPRLQEATARLLPHPPDMAGSHPAALALRTGEPQWSTTMDEMFMVATTDGSEHFDLTQTLGFRSYVSVPLIADHEAIGALTVVTTAEDRTFGQRELQLAQDLGHQVAKVVERARTLDEQSTIARRLQESLLPRHRAYDRMDVALRYEAFGRGAQVGGDFYDVVPLDSGRLALVIGDVEGHDMAAATVMGQLRSALRAYLTLEEDPGLVLDLLDTFLARHASTERIATMALLIVDTTSGGVSVASAGHPAPMVCGQGGTATAMGITVGPPVGARRGGHPVATTELAPREIVVLYTDGLVEIGRPDYFHQLDLLTTTMEEGSGSSSDALADRLVQRLTQRSGRSDDAALLVAKWTG
jgi:PAS domain S-box-containing protein